MSCHNKRRERRAGVSLLELQVAFVVFGIALAGLAPLTMMHLKQVQKLEQRLNNSSTYYLVPSSDSWVRKLGAAATISNTAPEASEAPLVVSPANEIRILWLDRPSTGDELTARVSVTPLP